MKVVPSICVLLALTGCSPNGPGQPTWGSGKDNIAFAISAICAPYVFERVDASQLPLHRGLVQDDGWRGEVFPSQAVEAGPVRVGYAGFIHVRVSTSGVERRCEISALPMAAPVSMTTSDAQARKQPDVNAQSLAAAADEAQMLRTAALDALSKRPEGFSPTRSHYLPGRFATEDRLCAAAQGVHPGGFVLLSAGGSQDGGLLLLTIVDGAERSPSCDQAGVPMNFRTLDSGL